MKTQTNVISTPSLCHFERRPQAGAEKSLSKRFLRSLRSVEMTIIALITALLLASCETARPSYPSGKQIDEETLKSSSVSLTSMKSSGNIVHLMLTEGSPSITESIYATINRPSSFELTVVVNADPSLVETYNKATGSEYEPLPAAFYNIKNGGVFKINAKEKYSEPLHIEFSTFNHLGNMLKPGHYLLPIVAAASAQEMSKEVVYYDITVREPYEGDAELYDGTEIFFVFYLNTSQYGPRLASDYYMTIVDMTGSKPEQYVAIGNLINLRRTTVGYDASSGRALLDLGTDMKYVLNQYSKYITPLQEEGRKVCLSIEGANTGLGFCNMTDTQIKDFVEQVKLIFNTYPLDGLNLWDRNSGYSQSVKNGLPKMNTTSYPKLIKALREMLGPDRLLTLTDYEEPTEYFGDTEATGGIQVGEYLDYAWSGYCNSEEGIQVIDPWHQKSAGVSTLYSRNPIPGLDAGKYGCVNIPWVPARVTDTWEKGEMNLVTWSSSGFRQSRILLFEDLRTNLQDANETNWDSVLWTSPMAFNENFGYSMFDKSRLWTNFDGTYGKWLKDW